MEMKNKIIADKIKKTKGLPYFVGGPRPAKIEM